MQVKLENDGEKKTVEVNEAGNVYVGRSFAGKTVEIAYEVKNE